jgi:hypothetical protein
VARTQRSGYYYPNNAGRIFLQSLEDVMGKNGVGVILTLAGCEDWIDNYPPDNIERGIDFAEISAVNGALVALYGPRGGAGIARRAGWSSFDKLLRNFSPLLENEDVSIKTITGPERIKIGLQALARLFSQISDQKTSLLECDETLLYVIHRCPICWERSTTHPVCYLILGLLEESLRWLSSDEDYQVRETKCIAVGDEVCEFHIGKTPISDHNQGRPLLHDQ